MSHLIITLDGPAGVGKSTVARNIAQTLRLPVLDTGAMFRFLALKLGPEMDQLTPEELEIKAGQWRFTLENAGSKTTLLANGEPLGPDIRTEAASQAASRLGLRPEARTVLKAAQREIGRETSLVAEGRDMGTVVFPDALCKFFLDARSEVRAKRRMRQLQSQGQKADYEKILADIEARDQADRSRAVAPLKPAADAVVIDTSDLNIDEVEKEILWHVREKQQSLIGKAEAAAPYSSPRG